MTPEQVRLAQDVKNRFRAEGISVAQWARDRRLDLHTVYRLLNGRANGYRGKSYTAAVALGLVNSTPQTGTGNPS